MVKIYGTSDCAACKQAVSFCYSRGIEFQYIDMMEEPQMMDALVAYIGAFRTVPQILVDEQHVGGLDGFLKHMQ